MHGSLRALVGVATTVGLLATLGATATPSSAETPPAVPPVPKAKVSLAIASTPSLGGDCVLKFGVRASGGRIADDVIVEKRINKAVGWTLVGNYRTSATGPTKIKVPAWESATFRVVHPESTQAARARSTFERCKVGWVSVGSSGKTVKKLQKRLRNLNVRPSSVNGRYDSNTQQAVMAFQKHSRLPRTGRVDLKTWNAIATAKVSKGPKWCRDADRICIDISKQVAYLRTPASSKPYLIPVSSGNEQYYTQPQSGARAFANTPRGRYKVWLKRPGQTDGDLGTYYWFSAFYGGWGVHGSNSVPSYPASHGCVRVPRSIEQWVYKNLPTGAYVNVHD
jgi:peptidoglycan hydrolase-like protein with peptidoglycan-binding domain